MQYEKQIDMVFRIVKDILGTGSVKTILEIGARDGSETVALHKLFPAAKIYSFECNAATIGEWKRKTKDIANIITNEIAVSDKNGTIDFFAIDQEKTETTWKDGNPGASSLLQSSDKYEVEKYVQNKTTVETTRLDTFFEKNDIKNIDLIWMDIQGAELMALMGAGERINDIKIIHTEVEFFEIYKNQPLFKEIKKYLNDHGFYLGYFTSFGQYSGDAVFIHQSIAPFSIRIKNIFLYPALNSIKMVKKIIKKIIKK